MIVTNTTMSNIATSLRFVTEICDTMIQCHGVAEFLRARRLECISANEFFLYLEPSHQYFLHILYICSYADIYVGSGISGVGVDKYTEDASGVTFSAGMRWSDTEQPSCRVIVRGFLPSTSYDVLKASWSYQMGFHLTVAPVSSNNLVVSTTRG